jgi:hypothetical protein
VTQWPKRGIEQAPKVQPPPRSKIAPAAPPVSSGRGARPAKIDPPGCKDCGKTIRGIIHPGPRHLACWRIEKKRRKAVRQDQYQRRNFDLTLAEKEELIEFQGGGCICADWTGYNGATRALSTDHDHATGVVRGALCKHCNDLLGRVRDDPQYFRRMIAYLEDPPAVKLFGRRIAPEG